MLIELVFLGFAAFLIVHDFWGIDWQTRFDDFFDSLGFTRKRRQVPVRVIIENTDIRRYNNKDY